MESCWDSLVHISRWAASSKTRVLSSGSRDRACSTYEPDGEPQTRTRGWPTQRAFRWVGFRAAGLPGLEPADPITKFGCAADTMRFRQLQTQLSQQHRPHPRKKRQDGAPTSWSCKRNKKAGLPARNGIASGPVVAIGWCCARGILPTYWSLSRCCTSKIQSCGMHRKYHRNE